jgi:hypothetical protein
MPPMPPMLYAIVARGHGTAQRKGGGAPYADSPLSHKHETDNSRPRQSGEPGGDVLASAALRIDDPLHLLPKFRCLDRCAAVAGIPRLK